MPPLEEFGPHQLRLAWGVDAEANPSPRAGQQGDGDVAADDDPLANLPCEDEHGYPP
jgi:hypothetical protein